VICQQTVKAKKSNGSTKKYVYARFTVSKPKLHHTSNYDYTLNKSNDTDDITWEDISVVSEIKEIKNYSSDEKYKFLDMASSSAEQSYLAKIDAEFQMEVFKKVNDYDKKQEFMRLKSKITRRECLVFNTYSEASISRENRVYQSN